jgi:IMP cyclohydrolase
MKDDLSALANVIYSGRGIMIGMTPAGHSFVGYSLTGRSPSSQARELLQSPETRTIRTVPIKGKERLSRLFGMSDEEELDELEKRLGDGSSALIYYPAIAPIDDGRSIAISNGAQTGLVYSEVAEFLERNDVRFQGDATDILIRALGDKSHFQYDSQKDRWIDLTQNEPDAPNFTPRISGILLMNYAGFHVTDVDGNHLTTDFELEKGKGHLVRTYKGGNESPLLPFNDLPEEVTINSFNAEDIAKSIYDAIYGGQKEGDNYQVAAAVMLRRHETGELETAILNKSDEVA